MGVNCNDPTQTRPPFPALMTFHRDGTLTAYANSPVRARSTPPRLASGSASQVVRITPSTIYLTSMTKTAPLLDRGSSPPTSISPAPTASPIAPRSSSSTLMGICSSPAAAGRLERGLNKDHGIWCVLPAPNPFTREGDCSRGRPSRMPKLSAFGYRSLLFKRIDTFISSKRNRLHHRAPATRRGV